MVACVIARVIIMTCFVKMIAIIIPIIIAIIVHDHRRIIILSPCSAMLMAMQKTCFLHVSNNGYRPLFLAL
jgi:hypothetical protein